MKTSLVIVGVVICLGAGAAAHRTWIGESACARLGEQIQTARESVESLRPDEESQNVRVLNAAVDLIRIAWQLDTSDADEHAKVEAYQKELLHLRENIKQTRLPEYTNRYGVERAFERANELIAEIGGDVTLKPDG